MGANDDSSDGHKASEYPPLFPAAPTPTAGEAINLAIAMLMPGARRKDLPVLFDGRVSWHTIRDWRRGKLKWSAWARDLLGAKVKAHLNEQYKTMDKIMRAEIGRGLCTDPKGARLNEWRAKQKARE